MALLTRIKSKPLGATHTPILFTASTTKARREWWNDQLELNNPFSFSELCSDWATFQRTALRSTIGRNLVITDTKTRGMQLNAAITIMLGVAQKRLWLLRTPVALAWSWSWCLRCKIVPPELGKEPGRQGWVHLFRLWGLFFSYCIRSRNSPTYMLYCQDPGRKHRTFHWSCRSHL